MTEKEKYIFSNWFFPWMVCIGLLMLVYGMVFCHDCGMTSIGCYDSGLGYCKAYCFIGFVLILNNLIAWGKYDDR